MKGMVTKLGRPTPVLTAMEQSDTIYAVVLAANTSQSIALPANATMVVFSAELGYDYYVKLANETLTIPANNVVDGTAPELSPVARLCAGKTHVSLISASNCTMTLSFYS